MGEKRIMAAAGDFCPAGVGQAAQQRLLTGRTDERIMLAAHQQDRLAYLRQDRPKIEPVNHQRSVSDGGDGRKIGALEKIIPDFRRTRCKRGEMKPSQERNAAREMAHISRPIASQPGQRTFNELQRPTSEGTLENRSRKSL